MFCGCRYKSNNINITLISSSSAEMMKTMKSQMRQRTHHVYVKTNTGMKLISFVSNSHIALHADKICQHKKIIWCSVIPNLSERECDRNNIVTKNDWFRIPFFSSMHRPMHLMCATRQGNRNKTQTKQFYFHLSKKRQYFMNSYVVYLLSFVYLLLYSITFENWNKMTRC